MSYAKHVQEILDLLSQDIIGERVDNVHRRIRETYPITKFLVNSYQEAYDELTRYYQYHYAAWLKTNVIMDYDLAFSNMKEILEHSDGNFVGAIKDCITGRNGGLIEKITLIAEDFRKQAVQKYIGYIVGTKINGLSFNHKIILMQQYLSIYGRLLLPNERLLSVYELANSAEKIIVAHAQIICSFRKLLQ